MTKPNRIQLRRTKGWRMPPNTVSVARPGFWGNRFIVGRDGDAAECVRQYRDLLTHHRLMDMAKRELRGKNLACWCKPGEPCHADVLLELVNE